MTALEIWLNQATRHLSKDSAAQVRAEIGEHFESAREAALRTGARAAEAERMAIAALGDAKAANSQYRKVLLTSGEARVLREGNREAQMFCSNSLLKWLLVLIAEAVVWGATEFFRAGMTDVAWDLLLGGMMVGLLSAAPFLPVYTPSRARVFRTLKSVVLVGALGVGFHWSRLFVACLWPLAWVEWTRISIRRKLPVAEWPRQLYL